MTAVATAAANIAWHVSTADAASGRAAAAAADDDDDATFVFAANWTP